MLRKFHQRPFSGNARLSPYIHQQIIRFLHCSVSEAAGFSEHALFVRTLVDEEFGAPVGKKNKKDGKKKKGNAKPKTKSSEVLKGMLSAPTLPDDEGEGAAEIAPVTPPASQRPQKTTSTDKNSVPHAPDQRCAARTKGVGSVLLRCSRWEFLLG